MLPHWIPLCVSGKRPILKQLNVKGLMSLRNRTRFQSPVPRSRLAGLLTFTSEELLTSSLRGLSVGVVQNDDRGSSSADRERSRSPAHSSSAEESAESLLTEAKAALSDADTASTERLRELQERLFDLASCETTPPVLRQQLTGAQMRLQRVEVARDADATQVDDGVEVPMETERELGGGSGSSGQPLEFDDDELTPPQQDAAETEVEEYAILGCGSSIAVGTPGFPIRKRVGEAQVTLALD